MRCLLLLTISLLALTGCDYATENKIEDLERKVSNLESQLSALQIKLDLVEIWQSAYNEITIDPTRTEGFQRLDTSTGSFLVSVDEISPHLDGYRVRLRIGNPSTATYNGGKLLVKYGKRFALPEGAEAADYATARAEWEEPLPEEEINFSNDLEPASWNQVEFTLPSVPDGELGHIALSMQAGRLSLYE